MQTQNGQSDHKKADTRFSLLRHSYPDGTDDHWDLLLEFDSQSQRIPTFKLYENPLELEQGDSIEGEIQCDHRRIYLKFSGEISGNRGRADLTDSGRLTLNSKQTQKPNVFVFTLSGNRLKGIFELRCIAGKSASITRL